MTSCNSDSNIRIPSPYRISSLLIKSVLYFFLIDSEYEWRCIVWFQRNVDFSCFTQLIVLTKDWYSVFTDIEPSSKYYTLNFYIWITVTKYQLMNEMLKCVSFPLVVAKCEDTKKQHDKIHMYSVQVILIVYQY